MQANNQAIDVNAIINKMQVPSNLKAIYDKCVLSGLRIMFDKNSHKMMLAELDKPGPMDQKLADGIITLMYMLWTKSNKTLPPQIIVPVTVTLTLRAFDFLQQSHDPQATKEVLGSAMEKATSGIMERFNVTQDQLRQAAHGQAAPQGKPQPKGMVGQVANSQ